MDEAAETAARQALARGERRMVLDILMRAYGDAIYRHCAAMLRDAALTDETHQVVFVQAWRDLDRFAGNSSFKSWLFAIARHRCLDAAKIRRRFFRRFEAREVLPDGADPAPTPEAKLAHASLGAPLSRCLDRLTPEVRSAVLLRHREGMSYTEMADIAGEQAGTLQRRVARALPALRECLESQGVEP
jgi:RNA polymerase sigma-70 factor (ECF subfamily)